MTQRYETFESRAADHYRRFGAQRRPPQVAAAAAGLLLLPLAVLTMLVTLALLPLLVFLDPRRRSRP